jgi:hypothetical protein
VLFSILSSTARLLQINFPSVPPLQEIVIDLLWFLRRLVAVVVQGSQRIMQKMDRVLEK